MRKLTAALVGALSALMLGSAAQAANYLDEMGRMDAQIAMLRKQIEVRGLAEQAAGSMSLPSVRYVSGFDDDLSAVVSYGDGRKFTVKRGDILPGGIEVRGVRHKGVIVRVAKHDAVLDFAAPQRAGVPGMPMAPTGGTGLMPPLPQVNVPLPSSIGRAAAQDAGEAAPNAAAQQTSRAPASPPTQHGPGPSRATQPAEVPAAAATPAKAAEATPPAQRGTVAADDRKGAAQPQAAAPAPVQPAVQQPSQQQPQQPAQASAGQAPAPSKTSAALAIGRPAPTGK